VPQTQTLDTADRALRLAGMEALASSFRSFAGREFARQCLKRLVNGEPALDPTIVRHWRGRRAAYVKRVIDRMTHLWTTPNRDDYDGDVARMAMLKAHRAGWETPGRTGNEVTLMHAAWLLGMESAASHDELVDLLAACVLGSVHTNCDHDGATGLYRAALEENIDAVVGLPIHVNGKLVLP
jgi:hypothetical protein